MRDQRGNSVDRRVECPFFIAARAVRREIVCEGMVEGAVIRQTFPSFDALRDYAEVTCSLGCFETCPIYQAVKDMRYPTA